MLTGFFKPCLMQINLIGKVQNYEANKYLIVCSLVGMVWFACEREIMAEMGGFKLQGKPAGLGNCLGV